MGPDPSMATSAALYSPRVLALATSLAGFPLDHAGPLRGAARSLACGSALEIGLQIDSRGRIEAIGLKAHACAIGQAAAAIFAAAAKRQDRSAIARALAGIEAWLAGTGTLPAWPQLAAIAAARDYPARHGAITLAWRAALDALPSDKHRR